MEAERSAVVLDFADEVEALKRRQALESINQVRCVLAQLRKDVQCVGLIQEMSAVTLQEPAGFESEHLAALAGIQSTLEKIAPMLPSAAGNEDLGSTSRTVVSTNYSLSVGAQPVLVGGGPSGSAVQA